MKQVEKFVSLELATKLKALGVPQKSERYWAFLHDLHDWFIGIGDRVVGEHCSAFSTDELGYFLPFETRIEKLHANDLYGD